MLCDVISAVAEFMVRAFLLEECCLDSRGCWGLLRFIPSICVILRTCLVVPSLATVIINHGTPLKAIPSGGHTVYSLGLGAGNKLCH
jgi:hypothetical protein